MAQMTKRDLLVEKVAEALIEWALDYVDLENASCDYAIKVLGLEPEKFTVEDADKHQDKIIELESQYRNSILLDAVASFGRCDDRGPVEYVDVTNKA